MGILQIATLALATAAMAAPAQELMERSSQAKVCDATTKICYTEYVAANGVSYRIAVPDTATATAPFDIALSIVAPKAIGWAGIAWGGTMANDPLTVGWSNAASAVVSSRRTAGHTLPTPYAGASYVVLPSTNTNDTHWQLDVICTGCSSWTGAGTTAVNLDPGSAAVPFAFASSATAPADPSNNASRFGIHNAKGKWNHDLSSAKLADFASIVQAAEKGAKA
ncbi:Cellobiose dehydrogenase, cytochrome [Niveomyces insectorum RCEF 264]|uniref:Cellobiose dehydrogenase, cytochrome n=1 Tax=Niveomyces insectorum RCEF 264 TaxID=1081102 RepID=A0A167Q964_9HYPO|nr:Cellobiose dehydrogenase, cytochrome [Niveomyces insectorum RCEF 264]